MAESRKNKQKQAVETRGGTAGKKLQASQAGAAPCTAGAEADGIVSRAMVDVLVLSAAEGDASCAKLLVTVADRKHASKGAGKRRGPSLAMQLAAEPEWQEAAEEAEC